MGKTAVVVMNLGGPDGPESIRPFLFNFFMDKNIIRLPKPLRFLLANLIASRRSKREAGESYAELGNKSPLLANTKAQADALQTILGEGYIVRVHMRYWHPMADEVIQQLKDEDIDHLILLPLYPQYSTTTTRSSLQEIGKSLQKFGLDVPVSTICCYPFEAGFINASARLVKQKYDEMACHPRILFSAHGLPEDIVKDGDPYQWQCEESAKLIAEKTGIENPDWQICYQSRVGPKKWIGPSLDDALEKAAAEGKDVLIYPHAFVNEHVETLVELDIEYQEMATELGIQKYGRVSTVSTDPEFMNGLAEMVKHRANTKQPGIMPDCGKRLCPSGFQRCAMDQNSQIGKG